MTLTSADLGRRHREQRFNPLRGLTPAGLTTALDGFEAGYLRQAALIWEAIEQRDDAAKIAIPKRRKSVSRRPWDIIKVDDSPQAARDAEALTFFYNNLTATKATDRNVRGGFRTLVNQMMNAEFYEYAAHEIIWQPRKSDSGRMLLTAELRYVPLYFFENRTGVLRYTGPDGLIDGAELEQDGWMITTGEGLHKAISVCRQFKQLSLQDWINYSERFGVPGVHGTTNAPKGSQEYLDFCAALEKFANDFIVATGEGTKIELIEAGKTGDAPFAPMVERMDRKITALCRGADLGTISNKDAAGASLQADETNLLLDDDCENITEALNTQIDRFVLRWLNGPGHTGLAYIKLLPPVESDTKLDIEVDKHLLEHGGELDAAETYERYGRSLPKGLEGVRLRKSVSAAGAGATDLSPAIAAENDSTVEKLADSIGVPAEWVAPLGSQLAEIEARARDKTLTDAEFLDFFEKTVASTPELFADMDIEAFAAVLEASMGAAAIEGLKESIQTHSKKK